MKVDITVKSNKGSDEMFVQCIGYSDNTPLILDIFFQMVSFIEKIDSSENAK